MSEKNRRDSSREHDRTPKRAARERIRQARERDAARDRRVRGLTVAAAVVAVVAVAGGVGALVAGRSGGDGASGGPVAAPKGVIGEGGTAIPVGPGGAKAVITVYEDFRCPACGQFEQRLGPTVAALASEGRVRADYHIVSFIDDNVRGTGSKYAANAAACAQDAGAFAAYHEVLYAHQPPETEDAFGNRDRLLELAGKVPALKDDAVFRACVRKDTYRAWTERVQQDFGKSGYNSTPTVLLNGKRIYPDQGGDPLTPERLRTLVEKAAAS